MLFTCPFGKCTNRYIDNKQLVTTNTTSHLCICRTIEIRYVAHEWHLLQCHITLTFILITFFFSYPKLYLFLKLSLTNCWVKHTWDRINVQIRYTIAFQQIQQKSFIHWTFKSNWISIKWDFPIWLYKNKIK